MIRAGGRKTPLPDTACTTGTITEMQGTVLIVRHAEAEGNPERRFIGQLDVGLSARGGRQASALARRLVSLPVTRIVSSDLRRSRDTVAELGANLGLEITTDPRWREIANGDWSGLSAPEIERGWPDLWRRYASGEDVPRPGGERWADVRARAVSAFAELASDLAEGELAVVSTHGGPALALAGWVTGLPLDGGVFGGPLGPLANASITTIGLPGPRLLGVNDVGHLSGDLLQSAELSFLDRRRLS